ncbi:phage tail sheath subtilisin-like domain-containing protein [Paenibacillus sp. TAB 01]|uniref:phage tail sheath subtilisin-like domain-containing protein n=1 Tax=Paenibacillus sp. TAB 01 TaxID=3368988 RepID=UPI003750BC38
MYTAATEIDADDWTAMNKSYIEQAFLGVPSKVIVERIPAEAANYNAALTRLSFKKWNYLAVPGIVDADVNTVSTQIKTWRDNDKRTFKAVLPNSDSDHEGIINFTTAGIVVGASTYTASDYTARIAGILAGLPLTRSATYYVLPEVDFITEHTTPDQDIDEGELIESIMGKKLRSAGGSIL